MGATMPLTDTELGELDAANASGRPPVVFVHGLWLLAGSWDRWRRLFEGEGFATVAPGWPNDPADVEAGRAEPARFAGTSVKDVTDHYAEAIGRLTRTPVVIGHSFGGLVTQQLAGRGLAAAAVAIDPAPHRGVLPLPISALRSALPVLGNPANRKRAVMLTPAQFRYAFTNALSQQEADELYDAYPVPGAGRPLFEAAFANLNPASATKVDSGNPDRGPLLMVSGERDHTVPHAITYAAYKTQRRNPGVTEFVEIPGRGHSLVIDGGWEQVAQVASEFVMKHAPTS
jgi:pimeloyl-ACP methyl ester carboxylesterase